MKDRDIVIPVTVIIPVKNEELNIGRCLSKLHKFEKIIVVDSGSTDSTREIVSGYDVELVNFSWNGNYPKKRNWMLINHEFETPWVLFLDADELVSDEFCKEMVSVLGSTEIEGFWLNYTNYFLGVPLRFGVPQRKLALFRVGSAYYERIDEDRWSNLDMEVHEHPILNGQAGEIKSKIDHQDFRGIEKFIDRHQDYAKWEAKRYINIDWSKDTGHLTDRQKFKYRHMGSWWYPLFYFLYSYLLRLGFLDGSAGFAYSFYKAWYFFMIRNLMVEDSIEQNR
ncbi:glycosyltransferase family 2 protein [Mesorhizobium sp. M0701]|uniref:glycosyltransferase family 2 protein n=1 Tax=unclassified Mesorhizobium TaxID=325217 RepID=UPI0033372FE8